MTNENIIKQLKRLIPSLQYADDVNAVKGAIQALEKENIYDDGEHYVTISKALYDKLNTDYEALSQELCEWGKMTFDAISGMSIFEFSDGTVKRVKQAELEPCEDAISRDAVIKIIEDAETARLRGDIDLLYAPILKKLNELTSVNPQPCDDAISRILKRMWNCRGKHTTSIDKVKMEQIIREELSSVTKKTLSDREKKTIQKRLMKGGK